MLERIRPGYRLAAVTLVFALLVGNLAAVPQVKEQEVKSAPQAGPAPTGQRVFSCGHSFHFFMSPILSDLAKKSGITDHQIAGQSYLGGSRVIHHWNIPEEKNKAREALRAGKVDVLTLAPIYMPDDGIEKFAKLALEGNPKIRITVQESWLPYDVYDTVMPLKVRPVDHNAITGAELRTRHAPYFKSIDDHIRELNKQLGQEVLFVVPVGQAVIALREKIIAGQAPGLKTQKDLFTDAIGHVKAPVMVLNTYCHYAVIYRRSPVGLPMPTALTSQKNPDWGANLNRLLQEVAWEAVTRQPLSGVRAEGKP